MDAIRFAAMKTANKTGDVRKAFQICKVAAERVYEANIGGIQMSEQKPRPIVRTQDVSKASRDMFHSTYYKAISCSTNYQALLLISIGALMKLGREKFTVQEIREKMKSISDASGERRYTRSNWLGWSDVLYMVTRLGEVRACCYILSTSNSFLPFNIISLCSFFFSRE
jgi:Cdc6-like AAA superfamily ATPase